MFDEQVDEVVAGMEPVLGGRTVEIDIDSIEVAADRRGLRRILQNLLGNAARHSLPRSRIHIRARREDGTVVVEVRDEGEGIPEELLPKVFERYERGRQGGTGIGLSIVKQYVELHGGQVDVESVEGEGATFRFTLPVA